MLFAVIIVTIGLLASPAQAGDAARGLAFARSNCAMCHAVASTGRSPNRAAPSFPEIARRYPPAQLEEAFAEGILVGHSGQMPEFQLNTRDIEDLIAYLERLRRQRRG